MSFWWQSLSLIVSIFILLARETSSWSLKIDKSRGILAHVSRNAFRGNFAMAKCGLSMRNEDYNDKTSRNRKTNVSPLDATVESPSISRASLDVKLPKHNGIVEGKLDNGFSYIILPNGVPQGRFEAHLEILSGSAFELERQQGMAHLLEHVAYMGSPKRQLISGTGSRTNAYTDFHHTVFYASCPSITPGNFWNKPMLPLALDALLDVMTTGIDEERLEKERAAVLSEASMINKMEYRVECQILSALHSENRISKRFPIGKENLIKTWTRQDVQLYHSLHYRPDNVILYVVGDVDVAFTIETIKQKFGSLSPKVDAKKIFSDSREFPDTSMKIVNRHFPPVIHNWSTSKERVSSLIPPPLISPAESKFADAAAGSILPKPRLFSHELMQSFSFHLFAKRPMEPVTSFESLRRELMKRMALSSLQIRFNVMQRNEPLFTYIDFNQLNWPREGCAVCSMDMNTDPSCWKDAVKLAVREIRRLGKYGLTNSELSRYKQAILSEAEQSAAQADQMNNEVVLNELMEAEACGHTFMHPNQRLEMTFNALESISLEDVNIIANELCEHLSDIKASEGVRPAAIVACSPLVDRDQEAFSVTEDDVVKVILEALKEEIEPPLETIVPGTLITKEEIIQKAELFPPSWVPLESKAQRDAKNSLGVVQKRLSNGIKINLKSLDSEPQRASIRLYVPGGRMLEDRKDSPGSVMLGARTMQEGGAFLDMTREEVELFCIDHLVMVEIIASDGALIFDFQTVTTLGPSGDVTGLEASLQVAHIILTDFKFEEDAFQRAKQGLHEQFDSIIKSLETASLERIITSISKDDERMSFPTHSMIDKLSLPQVKEAIVSQLSPETIEVSICGDMEMSDLEQLSLKYFGTIPSRPRPRILSKQSLNIHNLGEKIGVYLPDLEERAMGYLYGPSPNVWGVFADGSSLSEMALKKFGKLDEKKQSPLYNHVVLLVLQEVINRRLFSIVREERRLTYDASFQFRGDESINGGWYLISVTSSPTAVQEAIEACKVALNSLKGSFGVMGDAVQSAKRTLINRYRNDLLTSKFWVDSMSGTQLDTIPAKTLSCISDYESVVNSITIQDVQQVIDILRFEEDNMTSCIGIASSSAPSNL